MTHSIIYTGDNTHVVELVDLQDQAGAVQTDATVQMTDFVDKRTGVTVTGAVFPLGMPHIAAGTYRATIAAGLGITAGRLYLATLKAVGSQGFQGEWTETVIAQVRVA